MLNLLLDVHEALGTSAFRFLMGTGRSPYNPFRRSPLMAHLKELNKTQWLSPEEIAALQLERMKKLLLQAYLNVPYYRHLFDRVSFSPDEFRSLEDMRLIPVLTKADIQAHLSDLRATNLGPSDMYVNHTGGSTGTPLTFYQSYEYEAWGLADIWRSFMMCGFRPGQRRAFLWGSDYDSAHHRGFLNRFFHDLLRENMVWFNTFSLNEALLERAAQTLRRFRPHLIIGYVSSLTLLARFLRERGIGIRPEAVQTSAEVLTPAQRALIEETFRCKAFDRYGCREVGNVAHECEAHEGLHLLAENNLTEFLQDGHPAKNGESGHVTVTNLHNYAMPFIRYQTGDVGKPTDRRCSCGRGLPLMEVVEGRSADIITAPSGRLIHGEFFTHLFYKLEGIRQFQVIQEDKTRLTVKIVPLQDFKREETLHFLDETIHTYGDPAFEIDFEIVDSIPPSSSGKYRFTLSRVQIDFTKGRDEG